jgi:hypothetical protein
MKLDTLQQFKDLSTILAIDNHYITAEKFIVGKNLII